MTSFIFNLQSSFIVEGAQLSVSKVIVDTKQNGINYPSRVQITDRRLGTLFALKNTDLSGQLSIILPAAYATNNNLLIVALDDSGTYNAVVNDNVRAEFMP